MPKYKKGGYGRHSHTYETQTLMSFVKRVENCGILERISNLAGYQLIEQLFLDSFPLTFRLLLRPKTLTLFSTFFTRSFGKQFCVVIQAFCRNTHITSARHFGHPFFFAITHHSPQSTRTRTRKRKVRGR